MSVGSSLDVKEQVRQAIDIVDLIGGYLELRRDGHGYKALCPWHNDTRPSLQVNPQRQTWKCWVCDVGGDIFSFVMQREGVEFRQALEMLADRAGIATVRPDPDRPQPRAGSPDDKRTLFQATAWAEALYHRCLREMPEGAAARAYLAGRGIREESVAKFHLGYAPHEFTWLVDHARHGPFSLSVLERVGLVGKSQKSGRPYDRFRGRVLFSIRDAQGRPIATGGRILPGFSEQHPAKYINSPETPLFSKSNQLYGLDVARDAVAKRREVLVMEGYTDVVIAHQCGIDHAVAVLGTALGERHISLLQRQADSITLVLDGDEAGQRRANDILELFVAKQVDLKILTLPEGLDPCDFLLQRGADEFRASVATAVDALEHKVRTVTRGLDTTADTHRSNAALEDILSTLAKAPRLQLATSNAARLREHQLLSRLARQFHVAEEELRSRLTSLRNVQRRRTEGGPPGAAEPHEVPRAKLDPWERELLEILIQFPGELPRVRRVVTAEMFAPGPCRQVYTRLGELAATDTRDAVGRLLLEMDDAGMKNLLVELDERGREKFAGQLADQLDQLLASFQHREEQRRWHADRATLQNGTLDEQEQLKLLEELVKAKRARHGISGPTDG